MKRGIIGLTVMLIFFCLVVFQSCQTSPKKLEVKSRKVINSPHGEVIQDARYPGDTVQFKIYFKNESRQEVNIRITDQLDSNLSHVQVMQNGKYDSVTHRVSWFIENVMPGKEGSVEFHAVVGKVGETKDTAEIQFKPDLQLLEPKRPPIQTITTNTVTVNVLSRPRLGWIPFEENAKPSIPLTGMKDETTSALMVNFDIPGMFVHEVKESGITYHRLTIPGRARKDVVGEPEVPVLGQIIEVPFGVSFDLEIYKSKSITLTNYNVYPAQEPLPDHPQSRLLERKFQINKSRYQANQLYPARPAVIDAQDIGVVRGHRIVLLKANPVQYNPVTHEIKAYSNLEIRIKYDHPAQVVPVNKRLVSRDYEELLQSLALNYKKDFKDILYDRIDRPDVEKMGCDYLIITHADFYNANNNNNPIVRFAQWKRQKGYVVKVVKVGDIPNTAGGSTDESERIIEYLQNAYDKWAPPPTYVLLVGDSEFIETNEGQQHTFGVAGYDYNNARIGTDLDYATQDGTDYFPDILVGRISVDTLAETEDVIDKIIDYEKNPPANNNFYDNMSFIALFEDVDPLRTNSPNDNGNGTEDRPWIECAEDIRAFLQNQGYTVERIYTHSATQPGVQPQQYENGNNLPNDLLPANFAWNGSDNDISNAINNGRILTLYRDHGDRRNWSNPFDFGPVDIGNLANRDLTPVIFSVACENGWFDNETDDDATLQVGNADTTNNDESFCEEFIRHNNGGTVGIIGATRVSYTGHNDFLTFGFFKAIWPAYNPAPPIAGYPAIPAATPSPLVRLGQVHTFGKMFMASAYGASYRREIEFEMFHLFGDPEMPLWTEEPAELKVLHPEGVGSIGQQDFIIKVLDRANNDPVHMAMVVLTRGNMIVDRKQTNPDGWVRFTLNSPSSSDKTLLTVTALNYRPYEKEIDVTGNGAEINRLMPDNGIVNHPFNIGGHKFSGSEDVDLYFDKNLLDTKTTTTQGKFGQVGVENYSLTVPSGQALGPVNVLAHGKNSDRYAVDVFQVRTANPIDLYTYSQWDNTTWHLHSQGQRVWDNPEIQLYDSSGNPVASNNLQVGSNYTIKARIHNDTAYNAQAVKVTFKWANFGVGQPDRVWDHIRTVPIDVPAHQAKEAQVPWSPPSTGHLCLLIEIYHVEDVNTANNKGQENCHVGPTSSPAVVDFEVWNPTPKPAMVYLELRQIMPKPDDTNEEMSKLVWASWLKHPDPQLIPPGRMRNATVIIDPDKAIKPVRPGQKADFVLTGYINGEMIGGVHFTITKK